MPYKVLIRSEIEPYHTIIPMIEQRAEIVRWKPLDPQPPAELLRTIEGVYNYGHYAFTAEYMDLMPELRVISNYGVGVDYIDLQVAFARGAHGKPFLQEGGLHFNVSHTHELALYAIARDREVGVDVEWMWPQVAHEQIAAPSCAWAAKASR